jgi:hypothetical protein
MVKQGRHLLLAGMTPKTMRLFDAVGLSKAFGRDVLFPTQSRWFLAMNSALEEALRRVGPDNDPPLHAYLAARAKRSS